jgi:hypothetical protein
MAAGIVGAQAVLAMKSLTQVVTAVGGGGGGAGGGGDGGGGGAGGMLSFLTAWQFYVMLLAVGALEVGFLTAMNLGLDRWDAMLVVPVFQTFWTLTSVAGAIVLDGDFAGACVRAMGALRALASVQVPTPAPTFACTGAWNNEARP